MNSPHAVTFSHRQQTKIESAPENAFFDRTAIVFAGEHVRFDADKNVIRVTDDFGRELVYRVTNEVPPGFYAELVSDYAPNRDEADFVDVVPASDDADALPYSFLQDANVGHVTTGQLQAGESLFNFTDSTYAMPVDDEVEELPDDVLNTYDYDVPGDLEVLLFDGRTLGVSNVVSVVETETHLYAVKADGAITTITTPFVAYTVQDLYENEEALNAEGVYYPEGEKVECGCDECQEERLDREALDALKAKVRAENEQRAKVEELINSDRVFTGGFVGTASDALYGEQSGESVLPVAEGPKFITVNLTGGEIPARVQRAIDQIKAEIAEAMNGSGSFRG